MYRMKKAMCVVHNICAGYNIYNQAEDAKNSIKVAIVARNRLFVVRRMLFGQSPPSEDTLHSREKSILGRHSMVDLYLLSFFSFSPHSSFYLHSSKRGHANIHYLH